MKRFSASALSRYASLLTEQTNPSTRNLDTVPLPSALALINREDQKVAIAVRRELKPIARAVRLLGDCLSSGGRLVFFGAGTSGRLGVLEAAE
jgi:N-acetylmuramic acid 6-phosphate etherase